MTDGFRQELRYLRDSGYIATNNIHIGAIPDGGKELSEHVYSTELGNEFIERRRKVEQDRLKQENARR